MIYGLAPPGDAEPSFGKLLVDVRAGNQAAACAIEQRFSGELRAVVRSRYRHLVSSRLLDLDDVCQAAIASLLLGLARGRFSCRGPGDLKALLYRIARNKVARHLRDERAACRDTRRNVSLDDLGKNAGCLVAHEMDPCEEVALCELQEKLWQQLSHQERHLANERAAGRTWEELAAEMHEPPEALRKRLARAIRRATDSLPINI